MMLDISSSADSTTRQPVPNMTQACQGLQQECQAQKKLRSIRLNCRGKPQSLCRQPRKEQKSTSHAQTGFIVPPSRRSGFQKLQSGVCCARGPKTGLVVLARKSQTRKMICKGHRHAGVPTKVPLGLCCDCARHSHHRPPRTHHHLPCRMLPPCSR